MNQYFTNTSSTPSKWIDLYHKISKRNEPETGVVQQPPAAVVLNQTRRSKRRKTEINDDNKLLVAPVNPQKEPICEEKLWTEKYQFTDESDIVYNKNELERLTKWLEQFKKAKKTIQKVVNSQDEDSSDSFTVNEDDSDFNYDSDSSTSTTSSSCSTSKKFKFFNNAVLLNGPCGSGKTSAVYCVANKLGFKLFECNTSSLRSKTQIIQELLGVLSSHHVGLNKKLSRKFEVEQEKIKNPQKNQPKIGKKAAKKLENKSLESFFKKKPSTVLVNSTNDNSCRKRRKSVAVVEEPKKVEEIIENEVKVLKDSIILFDDIDVVLKEDIGFWSVISFFIKNSKKPIILTCNDEKMLRKIDLNIEEIKFNKPNKDLCLNYLKTILLCESKRCLNEEFYLNKLICENKCDLRHSLLQLQFNTSACESSYKNDVKKFEVEIGDDDDETIIESYTTIDYLNKNLLISKNKPSELVANLNKFDYFICKEGLIDSTESTASDENFWMFHRFTKELISSLSKNIGNNYSNLEFYEPETNKILYKFASTHFRYTSCKSLYTDYAPCLKSICKVEQLKQESNSKRRFLHYLNTTSNIGLSKEDYFVLAKDYKFVKKEELIEKEPQQEQLISADFSKTIEDLYESM